MDFFARQEHARAQTRQLIFMFVLAVIVVVLAVTASLVLAFAIGTRSSSFVNNPADWLFVHLQLIGSCAVATLTIIAVGTTIRSAQLQGGGAVVARSMGADLVDPNTSDPLKRRLLNVVEEMAIASGVPVPAVYVMERENGINAFAAGHTAADSAITVTRGTLERLDRAELQGVIGHEFSHILNGDMRLNMRLLGFVAGLFAIATVGRVLTRAGPRRGRGNMFVVAGLLMVALGYVGLLLGRMIQAAIARQREFLADASAVQFTRDPQGLRDALVKVGASEQGSALHADQTEEVSHMLFASGLSEAFATHPPLVDRIRALDPSFDAEEFARVAAKLPPLPPPVLHDIPASALTTPPAAMVDPSRVAATVGQPRPQHVRYAERLRAALPPGLIADAAEPTGARALLGALLWRRQAAVPQAADLLASAFGPDAVAAAADRRATLGVLPESQHLPLLLQLIPTLGRLPLADRQRLLQGIDRMVRADGTITLSEYALARLARVHLGEQIAPADGSRATLLQLEPSVQVVFSVLAQLGNQDANAAKEAYEYGLTRALPGRSTPYQPLEDWVSPVDAALDRLDRLRPADKERLVDALATIVAHDGTLDMGEAELLRAICGSLHCPLPPFVDAAAPTA
jgi:Zn-dependent protease with chaperone function